MQRCARALGARRAFARGAEAEKPQAESGRGGDGGRASDKTYALLLRALEPAKPPQVEPASTEQLRADAERAKDYSRRRMAEHRALQVDLNGKLLLMREAAAALPEELRAAAALPDYSPYPAKRSLPRDTHELRGFYEEKQAEAESVVRSSNALGGGKRR